MRTQAQVEGLISRLYQRLGKDPADLIQIKPMDGQWHDALSYQVTRRDQTQTRIWRSDLDDGNEGNIIQSLKGFLK
jgi:hypothetical protein